MDSLGEILLLEFSLDDWIKEQYFKAYFGSSRWCLISKSCPTISVPTFSIMEPIEGLRCCYMVQIKVLWLFNNGKVVGEERHHGTQNAKGVSNSEAALGSRNFIFYALLIFEKYWVRMWHWNALRWHASGQKVLGKLCGLMLEMFCAGCAAQHSSPWPHGTI